MELLVPQIVIDEFERNRERIETDIGRSVTSTFRQVRDAVHEHGEDVGREEALRQLDDLTHRVPLIIQMATRHFDEILELLQAGRSLEPGPAVDRSVVQRGLDKRAPFHRSKNSVADAALIEMYGEAVDAHSVSGERFLLRHHEYEGLLARERRHPQPPRRHGGFLWCAWIPILYESGHGGHDVFPGGK
jgi:hypothetical protein